MKKIFLVVSILAILLTANIAAARELPSITAVHKDLFKTMIKNYFLPVIHGWGIGYDCASDTYITVKFHVVSVKIIPRTQTVEIIREAKVGNVTGWPEVRDRVKAAIDTNGTTMSKGRISVNGTEYILTNITKTEDSWSAIIREMPNYTSCKELNISAEDCESSATQVGDVSVTKRVTTGLPGEPRIWAGNLTYNTVDYKFITLAYPGAGT